jgi:plasminogen activator inhibitor 1 RNA-binding protein
MPKKSADKPTARSGKRDAPKEAPAAPVVGDSSNVRGPRNPRRGPRGANEGGTTDDQITR